MAPGEYQISAPTRNDGLAPTARVQGSPLLSDTAVTVPEFLPDPASNSVDIASKSPDAVDPVLTANCMVADCAATPTSCTIVGVEVVDGVRAALTVVVFPDVTA